MLTVSDFGGWLLHWVAGGFLVYSAVRLNTNRPAVVCLRRAVAAAGAAFMFIGAIYLGFAVGGGSWDPTYSVGKFLRPYGKIGGGLSMAAVAWFTWRFQNSGGTSANGPDNE